MISVSAGKMISRQMKPGLLPEGTMEAEQPEQSELLSFVLFAASSSIALRQCRFLRTRKQ